MQKNSSKKNTKKIQFSFKAAEAKKVSLVGELTTGILDNIALLTVHHDFGLKP